VLEQAAHPGTEVKIAAALKWLSNPAIKIIASRWCLGVMVTLLLLVWLVALHRLGGAVDEVNEPRCKNCKYSLVGIDSSRCPECGWRREEKNAGQPA
ncbi:MAG: hypothetical protein ACE1ZA_05645, partial [Pseudomonadales bacterium]